MTYILKFFFCGTICAFLFPPFFLFPLGFIVFPYLYFILKDKEIQKTNKFIRFIYGTAFGLGICIIVLYWVREPFLFNPQTKNYSSLSLLLTFYIAIYFGFAILILSLFKKNFPKLIMIPVVFVLEDNQYAYSTPANYQYAIPDLIARAAAFGLPGVTVPGNNILDVRNAVSDAIIHARNGNGPTLIKANTMRMEGHALHDSAEYVPVELLDKWTKKDPISTYKRLLYEKQLLDDETERNLIKQIENEVSDGVLWAENSPYPHPNTLTDGVYA